MNAVPCNIDAEQALLGVLLYEPDAFDGVDGLLPAHFHEPFHGRLFHAAEALVRSGRSVAPELIADRFKADPAFNELGGQRYLANLVDNAPPAANAKDYAAAIRDAALRRSMISAAKELELAATEDHASDAADVLLEHERRLSELTDQGTQRHRLLSGSND
jgi:replicative DNA helicase